MASGVVKHLEIGVQADLAVETCVYGLGTQNPETGQLVTVRELGWSFSYSDLRDMRKLEADKRSFGPLGAAHPPGP